MSPNPGAVLCSGISSRYPSHSHSHSRKNRPQKLETASAWASHENVCKCSPLSTGNNGPDRSSNRLVSYARTSFHNSRLSIAIASACALRKPCAIINGKDDHVATRAHLPVLLGDAPPHFEPDRHSADQILIGHGDPQPPLLLNRRHHRRHLLAYTIQ